MGAATKRLKRMKGGLSPKEVLTRYEEVKNAIPPSPASENASRLEDRHLFLKRGVMVIMMLTKREGQDPKITPAPPSPYSLSRLPSSRLELLRAYNIPVLLMTTKHSLFPDRTKQL